MIQQFDRANSNIPDRPPLRVITAVPGGAAGMGGYRLRDGVVLVVTDDGTGRLLDLAGEACALSVSATSIVECALGADIDEACARVAARFKAEPGQIRPDMIALLGELVGQRMLAAPSDVSRGRYSASSALRRLTTPALAICAVAPHRALAVKAWVLLGLAFLAIRVAGWPRTAEAWLQASVIRQGAGRLTAGDDGQMAIDSIERAVAGAIARYPVEVSCKERALCCHALASMIGVESKMVLGIDLQPFALHCWCECGSRILAERDDGLRDRFIPFLAYS